MVQDYGDETRDDTEERGLGKERHLANKRNRWRGCKNGMIRMTRVQGKGISSNKTHSTHVAHDTPLLPRRTLGLRMRLVECEARGTQLRDRERRRTGRRCVITVTVYIVLLHLALIVAVRHHDYLRRLPRLVGG